MQDQEPSAGSGGHEPRTTDMDRLRRVAGAYGVDGTSLGPVADAIVRRTEINTVKNALPAVLAILSGIVGDADALDDLISGRGPSPGLLEEMVRAVERRETGVSAEGLTRYVLEDVRQVASRGQPT